MAQLISQREYGRRRGISGQAVHARVRAGAIPTHGARRQIDPDEADRMWTATLSPAGVTNSRFQAPPGTAPPDVGVPGASLAATFGKMEALAQARTAVLLTEVQLKRLRYQDRRAQLLDRQAVLAKWLGTVHAMREAWAAWPAAVAPELAADLGVDPHRLVAALVPYVRRQLDELAGVRLDLGGVSRRW
jgi:hypothetical protein